jgi:hypothetical protein
VTASVGAAIVAGAIAGAPGGLGVGAATALVLFLPRLRIVLGLVAGAAIVAAGTYVLLHQHADHVPAGGDWTLSFGTASTWAWAGVVFLGADGLVELILRRVPFARSAPSADGGDSDGPPPYRRYQQRLARNAPRSRGGRLTQGVTNRPARRRLRG